MTTSAQKQDIETSRRAQQQGGKKLEDLYQGFFGSRENCEIFAKLVPESFYSREDVVILDAGSSMGILGNYMREKVISHGKNAQLILIDSNGIALDESPVEAIKIEGDLLRNPLPNNSVDLIILRSVLQYVRTQDQEKLLRGLWRNLKPGGLLVSQFGAYSKQKEAEAFNGIFACANRTTNFFSKKEGVGLHKSVFRKVDAVIDGPILFETFNDFFIQRIAAPENQKIAAKKYISEKLTELGDALTNAAEPYAWKIPYNIVRCTKR